MTIQTELQKIREQMRKQEFTLAEFTSFHEEGGCQPNIKSCILCRISEILHSDQKGKLAACEERLVEGLEIINKRRDERVNGDKIIARNCLEAVSAILTGESGKGNV